MISLKLTDIKSFMSHLLIKSTFDSMLLCEADIDAACAFHVDGQINKNFYTAEEYDGLDEKIYSKWLSIKPVCYQMIKGSHTPSSIKLVFKMTGQEYESILNVASIDDNDVNGLYLNIKYVDGTAILTTGSSIKIFTMDKTLDKEFDSYIRTFLEKSGITYEEN